jgi:hypothetical protein
MRQRLFPLGFVMVMSVLALCAVATSADLRTDPALAGAYHASAQDAPPAPGPMTF